MHPPIVIRGNRGSMGFVVGEHPLTGEPLYRPGSGVVAGDGSQGDPFVIAGWCIRGSGPALVQDAIRIEETQDHLVVRGNFVAGAFGAGIALADAYNVTVMGNEAVGNGVGIQVRGGAGQIIRENTIDEGGWGVAAMDAMDLMVADNRVSQQEQTGIGVWASGGHVIRDNRVTNSTWGIGVADGAQGTRVVNNTLLNHVDIRVQDSDQIALQGNEMARGIQLVQLSPHRLDPRTLTIDGSNRVDGRPVVFKAAAQAVNVTGPVGQVLLYAVDEVRVSHVAMDHAVTSVRVVGSTHVIVENSSFGPGVGDAVRVMDAGNVTVRGNQVAGPREHCAGVHTASGVGVGVSGVRDSVLVADNQVTGKFRGVSLRSMDEADVHVRGNGFSTNGVAVKVERSDARVHNNTFTGNCGTGVDLVFPHLVELRDNLLENNRNGVRVETASGSPMPLLRGNNLQDHTRFAVAASTGDDGVVDARGNWWGCPHGPDGQACDDVLGDVDYQAWLTAPNPAAGA